MNGTARRPRPLTVEEFLAFEGEADVRYELVDGEIRAMAPASRRHSRIAGNAARILARAVLPAPCGLALEAGIRVSARDFFVADLVVDCSRDPEARWVEAPRLVVEILSPSTRQHDRDVKLDAYRGLPSVAEIWLVDSERRRVQQWIREGPHDWHVRDVIGTGSFESPVLAATVSLDELYEGVAFAEETEESGPVERAPGGGTDGGP